MNTYSLDPIFLFILTCSLVEELPVSAERRPEVGGLRPAVDGGESGGVPLSQLRRQSGRQPPAQLLRHLYLVSSSVLANPHLDLPCSTRVSIVL